MSWSTITAEEALARLARGARGLDVRSPGEFAQGALPGFTNVAVLDDDQRHHVGLAYKTRGPTVARALGHQLVEPSREGLVARWRASFGAASPEQRVLVCWRGGLRSSSVADALAAAGEDGVRVEGGYKAVRQLLLARANDPPDLLVLTGLTGSGKTDLLRRVPGAVDLEGAAHHRGSAFGLAIDDRQPAQQTFENRVGYALSGDHGERLIEDESAMIGRNVVPTGLRDRMTHSPMVVLEVSTEDRARRSFEDYVLEPARTFGRARVRDHVLTCLNAVNRRLGGLRTRELSQALSDAFAEPELEFASFAAPITRLLEEYYDPMYAHGVKRRPREVVFKGAPDQVLAFLTDRRAARR